MENQKIQKANNPEMQEYTLTKGASLLALANELTKFIKDRKLYTKIRDGYYVYVEAWTFAGINLGLMPVVEKLECQSSEGEIKYRAEVALHNLNSGQIVGRGIALCSNKESKKRNFDEFAIASMAQTRATGKAYRLPLGWLMKAAGYEATPAEEMDFQDAEVVPQEAPQATQKPAPAQDTPAQEKAPQAPAKAPITAKQQELIIKLNNSSVFTQEEKVKVLAGMTKLDKAGAAKWIDSLTKKIDERKGKGVAA
jgi:hypothetical protein